MLLLKLNAVGVVVVTSGCTGVDSTTRVAAAALQEIRY